MFDLHSLPLGGYAQIDSGVLVSNGSLDRIRTNLEPNLEIRII